MKVIGFYTVGNQYEKEKDILVESLKKFDLEYIMTPIENAKDWALNCAQKSKIILDALLSQDDDLLYIDVDAIVCNPIPEIKLKIPGIAYATTEPKGKHLSSGTLFFPNNTLSKTIVKDWIEFQKRNPYMFDQETLEIVLKDYPNDYSELSHEWCYINQDWTPVEDESKILIQHTRAAHRYKRKV